MDNTPNNNPQKNINIPEGINKPRLRKIKRPKQHNGPIRPIQKESDITNQLGMSATQMPNTPTQNTSIIRAENTAINNSDFNTSIFSRP